MGTIDLGQNCTLACTGGDQLVRVCWKVEVSTYLPVNNNYYCCSVAVYPHKPIIYERPRNATVEVGQTIKFECRVVSDPQPHIQWLKHYSVNGSYQKNDGEPYANVVYVCCLLFCTVHTTSGKQMEQMLPPDFQRTFFYKYMYYKYEFFWGKS